VLYCLAFRTTVLFLEGNTVQIRSKFYHALLFLAVLLAPVRSVPGQVLTVSPSEPKVGTQINVSYDESAPGAAIKGGSSLVLEAMVVRSEGFNLLKEIPLKEDGKNWVGGFLLEDERSLLLLFRVVSGDLKDDNGGNPWSLLVHGRDGKVVRDARVSEALFVAGYGVGDFSHERDFKAASARLAEERKEYPDNWRASTTEWMVLNREKPGDETLKSIAASLAAYEKMFAGNQEAIAGALSWYEVTGQKAKADSIRKSALASAPKGKIAENARQMECTKERDPAKRTSLLEKFITDFPPTGQTATSVTRTLVSSYVQAGRTDDAISYLNSLPHPDPRLYNQVAWDMIEKGQDLEQAVALAKKGVDLTRASEATDKPPTMRQKDWKEQSRRNLAGILDTYAFGLSKFGKQTEAAAAYAEAYALGGDEDAEITQRYLDCLVKAGMNTEAMKVSHDVIVRGKETPPVVEAYRASYLKVKGSDKGLDAALGDARAAGIRSRHDALVRSRVNKPSIDFTLKDLGGKQVNLSSLKGKVVVLDFWATWCGPCKASFPTLQKMYNKHRTNEKVAIYSMNTWERVSGAERTALVEKFMADNKYTFPVLYDESFVEKYGVDGIPTKFLIDKKGNIAFKSIGFNGAEEMERELTAQLDMLLAE
jgi:thiol-disulfide isomerase/thioredoxin